LLGGGFQFLVKEFCQPLGFRIFVGKQFLITAVKVLRIRVEREYSPNWIRWVVI